MEQFFCYLGFEMLKIDSWCHFENGICIRGCWRFLSGLVGKFRSLKWTSEVKKGRVGINLQSFTVWWCQVKAFHDYGWYKIFQKSLKIFKRLRMSIRYRNQVDFFNMSVRLLSHFNSNSIRFHIVKKIIEKFSSWKVSLLFKQTVLKTKL